MTWTVTGRKRGVWTVASLDWLFSRCMLDPSGCILWQLSREDGYGRGGVVHNGQFQLILVHRLSWELHTGQPIPAGKQVLHHCDVRHCVRIDDLFLGDNDANVADKVAKGRQYRPSSETARQMALAGAAARRIRRT